MSGPKTSRYTLTAEQRRIIAEQQRIERQRAVAVEKIKSKSKRLLEIGSMFSDDKTIASELTLRTGNDGGFNLKISELQAITDKCKDIISNTDNTDLNSLEKTVESLNSAVSDAEKLVKEIKSIAVKNERALRSDLAADIDSGFDTSFADVKITSKVDELKNELTSKIEALLKNDVLPCGYKSEIEESVKRISDINDEVFLKNYVSLTVKPLMKKCNEYISEYEQCHIEFEELYAEYNALCELYYYVPQNFICSLNSISKLKDEIRRIKEIAAEDVEQSYISDCIDEVMEEMGYSVLGSREVTKKNGKHFRNELYTYGEGTAVNVTYSSDGKIAMELGGIDTSDRLPKANESAALCDAMENFCTDFKEIEKRLASKGVILADRISLLPPSEEYAQIINTNDYKMQQKTEKLHVRKRQQSVQKNKSMKVE